MTVYGTQPDRGRVWSHDQRAHLLRLRIAVNHAARRGELPPLGDCECGAPAAVRHHDDYDQPLAIRQLCHRCHRQWHKLHGPGHLTWPVREHAVTVVDDAVDDVS